MPPSVCLTKGAGVGGVGGVNSYLGNAHIDGSLIKKGLPLLLSLFSSWGWTQCGRWFTGSSGTAKCPTVKTSSPAFWAQASIRKVLGKPFALSKTLKDCVHNLVENNWMVWLSRVKIISSDKHWAQDEMFFNSSVFVKTWYWSWIWLVFVLGVKCASHLHKCCPNQECQCSYLTPIKRPDSALHPCQSSLRYNCLHVWLSTIQTWIEFARFS